MNKLNCRVWDKNNETMIYSSEPNDQGKREFYPIEFCIGFSHWSEEWLSEIMLSSKLKDKEGNEIYDGDIIEIDIIHNYGFGGKQKERHTAIITFDSGAFYFTTIPKQDEIKITDCCWFHYNEQDRKVIGNIYQNADLLKQL